MSGYDDKHAAFTARQREIAKRNAAVNGVEIFRTGKHKAMTGQMLNYLDSDLREIAESYDPQNSPAPIVIGHPETDAPAYG